MSYELIKKNFVTVIDAKIPDLKNKCFATYADALRASPAVYIDIVTGRGIRTIKSGSGNYEQIFNHLVRVIIIADGVQDVDTYSSSFITVFTQNPELFTTCKVFGVSSVSPIINVFEEKDGTFRRDIDINVVEFV